MQTNKSKAAVLVVDKPRRRSPKARSTKPGTSRSLSSHERLLKEFAKLIVAERGIVIP